MFNEIIIILFLLCLLYLLFVLSKFLKFLFFNLKIVTGYILDEKVDKIICKSVMIGELHSIDKEEKGVDRVPVAIEKSISIATDVFLQNGIDPRQYNLLALTTISRLGIGLKLSARGGDINGKG